MLNYRKTFNGASGPAQAMASSLASYLTDRGLEARTVWHDEFSEEIMGDGTWSVVFPTSVSQGEMNGLLGDWAEVLVAVHAAALFPMADAALSLKASGMNRVFQEWLAGRGITAWAVAMRDPEQVVPSLGLLGSAVVLPGMDQEWLDRLYDEWLREVNFWLARRIKRGVVLTLEDRHLMEWVLVARAEWDDGLDDRNERAAKGGFAAMEQRLLGSVR